jgi:uncharacterized membrane protein YidH (DUF202 family)
MTRIQQVPYHPHVPQYVSLQVCVCVYVCVCMCVCVLEQEELISQSRWDYQNVQTKMTRIQQVPYHPHVPLYVSLCACVCVCVFVCVCVCWSRKSSSLTALCTNSYAWA